MSRTPLLAGNWKMHTTISEARSLAAAIVAASNGLDDREVMIAPPFTALSSVAEILGGSKVHLSSQNVAWEEKGAFTGEISPVMLKELGCTMAIIGHSERRHIFLETDGMINQRVAAAMRHGLIPILCIGETLEERETGKTFGVLETQVKRGLTGITIPDPNGMIIAYEPVWAIGTGKTASSEQVQETHHYVRQLLQKIYEKNIASNIRILYGGSVNPKNVDEIMRQEDVDGALVGGAALKADSFERIIHFR